MIFGEQHPPNASANGGNTKKENKHWLEYATAIFAFVAALGGICAAGFSGWQAYLTRQSLEITNRAFVSIEYTGFADFSNPVPGVNFNFNIVNKGATPTKDLHFGITCLPSEKELYEPWSLFVDLEKKTSKIVQIFVGSNNVPVLQR